MPYTVHTHRHSPLSSTSKHHQPNKVAIKYFYGIGWCCAACSVCIDIDAHTRTPDQSRQPAVCHKRTQNAKTSKNRYPVVLVMSASEIVVSSTKHNLNTVNNSIDWPDTTVRRKIERKTVISRLARCREKGMGTLSEPNRIKRKRILNQYGRHRLQHTNAVHSRSQVIIRWPNKWTGCALAIWLRVNCPQISMHRMSPTNICWRIASK